MSELIKREWHTEASCNGYPDPDLWHYENSTIPDMRRLEVLRTIQAIEICHQCPVRKQCLEQGLEPENINVFYGGDGSVWGGLMTSERALLKGYKRRYHAVIDEARHARQVRQVIGRIPV